MQKIIFLAILFIFGFALAQTPENENELRTHINLLYQENQKECSVQQKNAVTNSDGKIEFWKVCTFENGNRILQIESHSEQTFNQEVYFEEDGKLRYAKETRDFMPMDSFTQVAWNCEFYFEKGQLATYISLGHGKTENDEGEPESIIAMYQKRLKEFAAIKQ
ncbi:hypothetical protein [Maribacter halichondriae]|uniref:hypothetical protein n=1 Tax=Maribacter halichondriae TaxID=2980554 RepID=UPI002359A8DE|nr:hypothetical protein [Maribacter sp. Hal144]